MTFRIRGASFLCEACERWRDRGELTMVGSLVLLLCEECAKQPMYKLVYKSGSAGTKDEENR